MKKTFKNHSESNAALQEGSAAIMKEDSFSGMIRDPNDPNKTQHHSTFVNSTLSETTNNMIRTTESIDLANRNHASTGSNPGSNTISSNVNLSNSTELIKNTENSIFSQQESKGIGDIALKEIESAIGNTSNNEIHEKVAHMSVKYGYKAGKYAVLSSSHVRKEASKHIKHAAGLSKDVKEGLLTKKAAQKEMLSLSKHSLLNSSSSISKVVLSEASSTLENFHGDDDDLGSQVIAKPKNLIVKAKRSLAVGKKASSLFGSKATYSSSLKAGADAGKAASIASKAKEAFGAIKAFFGKIIGAIGGGSGASAVFIFIAAALLLLVALFGIVAIITSLSMKSNDEELTKTYKYVTEKDAKLTQTIREIEDKPIYEEIDEFNYFLNGAEVSKQSITIFTNADLVLLYFDCKYKDYKFDSFINGLFGGTNVKGEIDSIHDMMYRYELKKTKEIVDESYWIYDEEANEPKLIPVTKELWILDIEVTSKSFDMYVSENIDSLLKKGEKQQFEAMKKVGQYTTKQELGSPFESGWGVNSRFGFRYFTYLEDHTGIDINMPAGTPIQNVMDGKVSDVGFNGTNGNYVKVKSGEKEVLYAHLDSVSVSAGQKVSKKATIGTVGSTGKSIGSQLHLEYYKDGYTLCPSFYIKGCTGAGMGSGTASDLIAFAEQYIGLPYVWEGSAPPTFDCSGYVCWCLRESGTYPVGRTTAQGLYNQCIPISEAEAKVGDLVFFKHTYKSEREITHVGFFISPGQMLHCGDPIGYASYYTAWWQSHEPCFGRLR